MHCGPHMRRDMTKDWTRIDVDQLNRMSSRQDSLRWIAATLHRRFEDVVRMAAALADERKGPADVR